MASDGELGSRAWQMCPDRKTCTELMHRFIPNKGYEHLALIPLDEAGIYDIVGDPDAGLADVLVPNDDPLLASVMRKLLDSAQFVSVNMHGSPVELTFDDTSIEISDAERQAIEAVMDE